MRKPAFKCVSFVVVLIVFFLVRAAFKIRVQRVYTRELLRDEVIDAFLSGDPARIDTVAKRYALFYKSIDSASGKNISIQEDRLHVTLSPVFLKYTVAKGVDIEPEKALLQKTQPYVFYNAGNVWVATVMANSIQSTQHYFVAKNLW